MGGSQLDQIAHDGARVGLRRQGQCGLYTFVDTGAAADLRFFPPIDPTAAWDDLEVGLGSDPLRLAEAGHVRGGTAYLLASPWDEQW